MSTNTPDTPQLGRTAYAFYVQHCTEVWEQAHPNEAMVVGQFAQFLAECKRTWEIMPKEDKSYFVKLADNDKKPQQQSGSSSGERAVPVKNEFPIRPLSEFAVFALDKREGVKMAHPDWHVNEVAVELMKMWIHLDPKVKVEYRKLAEANRAFIQEKGNLNESLD